MQKIPQVFAQYFPKLNVADMDVLCDSAGPGKRLIIWLQGCLQKCNGCCNQTFLPLRRASLISPEDLVQMCVRGEVEGISLSGGEPFLQAVQLFPLIEQLKNRGYSIFIWTGYLLEQLRTIADPPEIGEILRRTDILVDGKFSQDQKSDLVWRGSINQHVYFLSDRYSSDLIEQPPRCHVKFTEQGAWFSGDIDEEILEGLRERLERYGVTLKRRNK